MNDGNEKFPRLHSAGGWFAKFWPKALISPPPALRAGMNMRITVIAFAAGRLGDSEFRRRL